jgi:hypothetical protein
VTPIVGRLVDRIGPRVPAVFGSLLLTAGLVLLAQLDAESTARDVTWRMILLGLGIGSSMPTFTSAAMSSLPPQVAGVGSGALSTLRQVGFSLWLAIVVAIFSASIADSVVAAANEAKAVVEARPGMSAQAKRQLVGDLERSAQAVDVSQGTPRLTAPGPLGQGETQTDGGAPADGEASADSGSTIGPPAGSPASQRAKALGEEIEAIFRDHVADSFRGPFYAAAIAALLAVVPSLFVGRRLGEHEGHHEMGRAERQAATRRRA